MIENKIDELFSTIEESPEYQSYKEIGNILSRDKEINKLIKEIKELQQKSVNLEYNHNPSYKEIDKVIEEKVKLLNSNPVYQEYLRVMNNFNDILSSSTKNIEDYINSKI